MNYRSSDTDYVAMVSITQNFQANTLGQPVEHRSVHWFIMFDNNIFVKDLDWEFLNLNNTKYYNNMCIQRGSRIICPKLFLMIFATLW